MTAIDLTAAVVQSHHVDAYRRFLEAKVCATPLQGFEVDRSEISPVLDRHQPVTVQWGVRGGRRAYFLSFGLGKTMIQLETVRLILKYAGGGRGLIVVPLGARQEFWLDARKLGWSIELPFVRSMEELGGDGIYLTNYETVREKKLDPTAFTVVSLDEADVLRSFGSKTFSTVVIDDWHKVPYRYVATATPDPNDYVELLGYAQFLDVMDIGQAKTRFFKRDSEHADHLTLHAHKENEFWLWVASWAMVIRKPSDLGFSDEGYDLPPIDVRWHEVPSDHAAGAGCNLQRHCHRAIFLGIGHKFRDLIQSIHRIHRFLQEHPVRIDLIYTEAERPIRAQLEAKWKRYDRQVERLSEIIREYGLGHAAMAATLQRTFGVERREIKSAKYHLINGDAVEEMMALPTDSVGLKVTSWPFSSQYEYTPTFNDFGHTDSNAHFFAQMDFLTPEAYRVLMPGRCFVLHVKDRVVPGGMTGLGYQTVYPFHADAITHVLKHGFTFLGQITIVTDVVRENNQTYRLGYGEQLKDGSRMGAGLPEYLLIFRKPPTDNSDGYADTPVIKTAAEYSLARWQVDAHGLYRSNGNRFLTPDEMATKRWDDTYPRFQEFSRTHVYDYEHHVAIGEAIATKSRLPRDFMLLPPASWHGEVWTDVTRMRSLNTNQAAANRIKHLCPLPFDIVDRVIRRFSNPGDVVLDCFAGLCTVPYRAVRLGRFGQGIELNAQYFSDGAGYCAAAEEKVETPSLFTTLEQEPAA